MSTIPSMSCRAVQAVVGAGVVDDRQPQPSGDGQREGFQDLGTTCSGVTQLMLWQPRPGGPASSRPGGAGSPARLGPAREMSWFWQNTQRRLQPEKKTVPEPFQPRRQFSSRSARSGRQPRPGGRWRTAPCGRPGGPPCTGAGRPHSDPAQAGRGPVGLAPPAGRCQPQVSTAAHPRRHPSQPSSRPALAGQPLLELTQQRLAEGGQVPGWREVMMMPPASETASTSSWSTQSARHSAGRS